MLAPIHSIKHYVNLENVVTSDAAATNRQLIQGVKTKVNSGDVDEGSVVKAIYIEMWFKGNAVAGTEDKFQLVIEKVIADQVPITFTQMNTLDSYPNKKNVFFYSQGVTGDLTTSSIPVVRGWFKIPKGKQRFGLDDELFVSTSTTGATANTCGFATFKEYS